MDGNCDVPELSTVEMPCQSYRNMLLDRIQSHDVQQFLKIVELTAELHLQKLSAVI